MNDNNNLVPINSKVDKEIYTNFKIKCIKDGLKIYEAIEKALEMFTNSKEIINRRTDG